MTRNISILPLFFLCVILFFVHVSSTYAQSGDDSASPTSNRQILSVTPPLFQIAVAPGDIWQSSVKVVNGSSYPLTIYMEVVNFKAVGEAGQGRFIPLSESAGSGATFGEWITLNKGPYTIPAEQTQEISFFVEIPKNASPGGHYAALLTSTEPPKDTGEIAVRTSQVVTSLLFMRVEGDINEEGTIREFRAIDRFVDVPDVSFSLRFENKGNVHLQPKGDIIITNMWGTERGTIPVNYQSSYGNVLPESIRDFAFSWKSDFKLSDVGRYKAIATLAYGEDEVKSTTAIAYFWIIPIKWTLIVIAIVALFVSFIVFMVKAYIRRMLMLAGVDVSKSAHDEKVVPKKDITSTYRTVSAPLRHGVIDLRTQLTAVDESLGIIKAVIHFMRSYKFFFISVCILIVMFITVTLYIGRVTDTERAYEVTIDTETQSE